MNNLAIINQEVITQPNNVAEWFNTSEHRNIIVEFLNREIADKTRIGYEHTIKHFFNVDSVEDISVYDIVKVTPDIAKEYKNALIKSGLNRGSVRTKIVHLKALFQYIMDECFDNNIGIKLLVGNPFSNVKVKTTGKNIKNASKNYGAITREEASKLIKVAMLQYAVLYELAVVTAVRKESLVKLNLSDIKQIQGKWCVTVEWDKTMGDLVEPISNELYEKCCKIADCDGVLFDTSVRTVNRKLKEDMIRIGISEEDIKERHLVFHSFKSTSADMALAYSGNDLEVAREHVHNTSIDTMNKYYAGKRKNPNNNVGNKFVLHDVDYNRELENRLRDMNKVELMELIMGLDKDMRDGLLESLIVKENKGDIKVLEYDL